MLKAYETFLNREGNVKPQHIPYYLKWVSECYQFLNEPLTNRLNSDQKRQFLCDMGKRYED